MENEFNVILNSGEEIITTYKPNKNKFYFSSFFSAIWGYIFAILFFTLMFLVPDEDGSTMPLAAYIILIGLVVVAIILQVVFTVMAYKKRVYCVTNQRLIIKCGTIGVDYRSLDLKYIGAVDVYVSFVDKIVHKNTGTLRFGSMSSPINANFQFSFSSISEPYKLYQKIKQIIEEHKDETK